jgi:hypothetical protein
MNTQLANFFGLSVVCVSLAGCASGDDEKLPEWLTTRIAEYEAGPPDAAPLEIWQLSYKGKPAFYVLSACCDFLNPLLDYKGEEICSPDGGFTGRGSGICPVTADFDGPAQFLWSHPKRPPYEKVRPLIGPQEPGSP